MLRESDIVMAQERYKDIMREVAQDRLIQATRQPGPGLGRLRSFLAEMLRAKISLNQRLIGWKSPSLLKRA
ncbi:MAG: hypothetical protein HYR94_27555 [Chloroflexi bacterium]|nr:hypothetical protein [Chloroflexota bacterium]